MLRFIAARLLQTIPVLFIVATVTFFMVRSVPGGPFDSEKKVPDEIKKQLEAYYGLNKPLFEQYTDYLWSICPKRFMPHRLFQDENRDGSFDFDLKAAFGVNFGPSFTYANRTVNETIAQTFPVSLELGAWSLAIALVLGISAGVLAGLKPNSKIDYLASGISMMGICIPTFVMGPLLVLFFALKLGWFNASQWTGPSDRVLPSLTLGLAYAAYVARLTRGGMLEVLNQDFIRTARAKGAGEFRVILRHALRGGLLPVVSFLGPATAGIITGSFVIETIFQIPGLGRHFITSAFNRDYLMVLGTVIFYATLVVVMNLIVDVVQIWLNPRLKFN
jgi:oligopeptide transport system permease protein